MMVKLTQGVCVCVRKREREWFDTFDTIYKAGRKEGYLSLVLSTLLFLFSVLTKFPFHSNMLSLTRTHARTHLHSHIRTRTQTFIQSHVTHTHSRTHTFIHTHTHIRTHTHLHARTHSMGHKSSARVSFECDDVVLSTFFGSP